MDTRPAWFAGALVVYCLVFAAQVQCTPARPAVEAPAHVARLAPEDALADTQPGLIPDRQVPRKPFEWQKKPTGKPPRCGPKEREIFGACYRRAHPEDYAPPCEAPTVEHESTCYYAVQAPKREPSSVRE